MQNTTTKGLEFMAVRFSIIDTHRWLKRNGFITLSESDLIDEIILGTVGARNPKNQMCSETDFNLKTLAEILGIGLNKLYVKIKNLNQNYLILKRPSLYSGCEILGLNPYFWGQILIDKSHAVERSRVLKCVINNVPKLEQPTPKKVSAKSQKGTNALPKMDPTPPISQEIIEEKPLLDSYKSNLKVLEGGEVDFDLENISPLFKKFATLKGTGW